MFYDKGTGTYLKIPFSSRINEILVEESNNPKNRQKENKQYNKSFEMLNEILETLDSDIFSIADDLVSFLQLDPTLVQKLKRTNSYASFMVLCFTIVRAIQNNLINSSFDIFQPIIFQKPTDAELFDYIYFYKDNKNFIKVLTETFENSADPEAFMEHLNDVLTNHLRTIVADTELDFGRGKKSEQMAAKAAANATPAVATAMPTSIEENFVQEEDYEEAPAQEENGEEDYNEEESVPGDDISELMNSDFLKTVSEEAAQKKTLN